MALAAGKTFACRIIDSGSDVKNSAITVMWDGSFHVFDPYTKCVVAFRPDLNAIVTSVDGFLSNLARENPLFDVERWTRGGWGGTFMGLLIVLQQLHRRVDPKEWKDLATFHDPKVTPPDEKDFPLVLPETINVEPFRRVLYGLPPLELDSADLTED